MLFGLMVNHSHRLVANYLKSLQNIRFRTYEPEREQRDSTLDD